MSDQEKCLARSHSNGLQLSQESTKQGNANVLADQERCQALKKSAVQPFGQPQTPLHETDWWRGVIANTNRMAVDEEFRKSIARDLS